MYENVFLINASNKINQIHFPLGLSVIANSLKLHGIKTSIIDLIPFPMENRESILKKHISSEPSIYGFGIIAGNNQIVIVEHYAKIIKDINPQNIIIYGGPLPTSVPKLLIENCLCDYILSGEVEFTLPQFIFSIRKNNSHPEDIPGLYYKKNNSIIGIPPKRIKRLDNYSMPYYEKFDINYYVNYLKETGQSFEIMTSRGCRGQCTFCYKFMGHGVSTRNLDDVLDEIDFIIKNYNINKFYIVDENFTEIKSRYIEFINKKKKRNLKFTFIIQSRLDTIDEEICKIGSENGLKGISTGVEAVSQVILNEIRKKITIDLIKQKLYLMNKYGIEITANFVIGFPEETKEYYDELIQFIIENGLSKKVKLSYLTPLPGSYIYQKAVEDKIILNEYEYIKELGDLYWEQLVNFTKLSNEDLNFYYNKINSIGQREVVYPKSERFLKQIRAIH